MLTSLSIRNIILIDSLDIQFEDGLCVLTGETGAGKSILLDALGFALGGRGSARLLRHGEKQGSSTAVFDITRNKAVKSILDEQGIDVEDELFLRRVIYGDGKSKAFVNDSPVSAGLLSRIADLLIEVHGQHDQKGLLNPSMNRVILDQFGKLGKESEKVREAYGQYRTVMEELESLETKKDSALAEQEYLQHVVKELESLSPKENEEAELDAKRKLMMNKEKLVGAVNSVSEILIGEAQLADKIRQAQSVLLKSAEVTSQFEPVIETLERSVIELDEATAALENIAGNMDSSEEDMEYTEERLFALRAAARKYNVQVDDLAEYCQQTKEKLNLIGNYDERLAELQIKAQQAREGYIGHADALSVLRSQAAVKMEKRLHQELAPLKMENTRFQVNIERVSEELWSTNGFDKITFLVSTNPGAPMAPLSKIASGGELSRFMLAMKVVLQGVNSVSCMIFDEVDTGIGGAVADAVGKRLKLLGEKMQVLVITHQPQVAARGNYHLKVSKKQEKDTTKTSVVPLSEGQRTEEIARMLSGSEVTTQAMDAAKSLMQA